MTTGDMIRELRRLEEVHRDDFVGTGEPNWSLMCRDVANRLEELLKAQEPRVMTISDFKDEGVYYLEALPPFVLRPVIYRLDYSDPRHYNFVWKYDQFTWNTDEYGKTWRGWTSRPTDEQREETPWN